MKRFLLTAALALPHLLFAQAPSGVSLDRDRLLVGETVTVVVNFEAATRWCGLRVDFGDGDVRDVKVEDFPLTLTKQYPSAGRYVIRASGRAVPRGLLSVLPCTGRPRTATLEVAFGRRYEPPRQSDLQGDGVDLKETQKNEHERQKQAEKRGREQYQQERKREQKDEREREQRDQREQRERTRRAGEAVRRPPAREAASAAVPVPAKPRTPPPPPAPAPAASKPRDGSLKVF